MVVVLFGPRPRRIIRPCLSRRRPRPRRCTSYRTLNQLLLQTNSDRGRLLVSQAVVSVIAAVVTINHDHHGIHFMCVLSPSRFCPRVCFESHSPAAA